MSDTTTKQSNDDGRGIALEEMVRLVERMAVAQEKSVEINARMLELTERIYGCQNHADLAKGLANRLWEMSTLRHGLFTPAEFRQICESVIAGYLSNDQVTNPTP